MADGDSVGETLGPVDIRRILNLLPHRYPMLLVDRVESMVKDTSIHAVKAVTMNEPFFQGHFPGRPIMPGVLIVEALAQAAGILAIESMGLAFRGQGNAERPAGGGVPVHRDDRRSAERLNSIIFAAGDDEARGVAFSTIRR